MSAAPVNPDLEKLLSPVEANLLGVARRQFLMEAFTGDLDRVTRGKRFRFRNEPVWLLLLDTRDMLVIHLTSWAKSVVDPGGLIDQIQAHHIPGFPRVLPPTDDDRSHLPDWVKETDRRRREGEHREAFSRLFTSAGAYPNAADFDALRQTFRTHLRPLREDRNWNRAHPFEKVSGTARMLNVAELRSWIDYGEAFMNDLRLVGCYSTMAYHEMNSPRAGDVAPDLVDAMLIGDPDRVVRLRGGSGRDEMYGRLHAEHDARPTKDDDYFNDVRMAPTSSAA